MAWFNVFLVASYMFLATILQGCGGGGGPTGPTPVPTPAPTSAPTIPHPEGPRHKPLSSRAAADYLNQQYLGFDESNDASPLGVTISMAATTNSFFKNIFCRHIENPVLGRTGCFRGMNDCRLSASLFNHRMIVTQTGRIVAGIGRPTGFVLNQSMVEAKWNKCSYVWDGATDNRYNRGCGNGAPGNSCSAAGTAWDNTCDGHTCTGTDKQVTSAFCQPFGGPLPIPPTHDGQAQCVFPGAALNYHLQPDYTPDEKYQGVLRRMAKERVALSAGSDPQGPNIEKWNEVVLDELLLLPDVWKDPAAAITAFVYVKSQAGSKDAATKMRDEFCRLLNVPDPIPVLAIDDTQVLPSGPFVSEAEEADVTVV